MPDPEKKRPSRAAPAAQVEDTQNSQAVDETRDQPAPQPEQSSWSEPSPDPAPAEEAAPAGGCAAVPAPQASAQVIDLDAVRADERRATLAYVAEVHELCALAGRGDLAAGFVAKARPVAQIRRALLEARAAEDEATAIRSQLRPALTEPVQPAIDTAAIYAARNQNVR